MTSPIFNYPYARTREALEKARASQEWDACHGLKMSYSNPETGDFAMPTIGDLHPAAAEGIQDRALSRDRRDRVLSRSKAGAGAASAMPFSSGVRAICSWCRAGNGCTHEADDDAVLFSFSDRPVQQKLDLFREDRGNA